MKADIAQSVPLRLSHNIRAYNKSRDLRSQHQTVLDSLQAFHYHVLALILGYYRQRGEINWKTEEIFFTYARLNKNRSFGEYLKIFRTLPKELLSHFSLNQTLPKGGQLTHTFNILKDRVIHQGFDTDLGIHLRREIKGKTPKSCQYIQILETVGQIRNISAHKENKAKTPDSNILRDWPLHDEYFSIVNPLLSSFLDECLHVFSSLTAAIPAMVIKLDPARQHQELTLQKGSKPQKYRAELTEVQFLLCKKHESVVFWNEALFPYYYLRIPDLAPEIFKQISEKRESELMKRVLKESIRKRFLTKAVLSPLDKLVLSNEARSYNISEQDLVSLMQSARSEAQKQAHVSFRKKHSFNIWWLRYFAMNHDSTMRKNWREDPHNISHMHHALWKECRSYLNFLKETYLDNEFISWSVESTNFQQGRMSSIFWGQIYLEEAGFRNALSIGFAVAKKQKYFTGYKTKNKSLHKKIRSPSVILWPAFQNNMVEDMGEKGHQLLLELYRICFLTLKENQEILGSLSFMVLSPQPDEEKYLFNTWNHSKYHFEAVSDFMKIPPEDRSEFGRILSPVITLADLTTDAATDEHKVSVLEDIITSSIQMMSSVIIQCNSWAQQNGISKEWMRSRRLDMTFLQRDIAKQIHHQMEQDPSQNPSELAKELGKKNGLSPYRIKENLMGNRYKKFL